MSSVHWEEQQREDKARKDVEYRAWRKSFVLVSVVIAATIAVSTVLANQWLGAR